MRKQLVVLTVLILAFACKKPEDRTCWKFVGDQTTLEVQVGAFDRLFLGAHLEYEIVQDSTNKLVILGGENLVKHVEWTNENNLLTIQNKNRCGFLRNAKKVVKVEIHCTSISNIRFEGSEPLTTKGTLKSDYFVLFVRDGAGAVNMNVQSIVVDADISHGWGDYTLSGTTQTARISAKSNGFCDTYGLIISDSLYVASETEGDVKVRCNGIPMYGYMKNGGNIKYKGTPSVISILNTGSGKVINDN